MKVGDRVRRIKEYQLGTWNYDHRGRENYAYTVIGISATTVYLNDSIREGWSMRYFEPAEQIMFNELIDLYYENNP